MKRRFFILSLLVLYISSTAGFAMNLHFCGSKLSEVKFNSQTNKQCCKKESAASKCCKNKHLNLKVSDEHQASVHGKAPDAASFQLLPISSGEVVFNYADIVSGSALNYRGPPPTTIPINLLNCTFRI
jgi:hypothetical protein